MKKWLLCILLCVPLGCATTTSSDNVEKKNIKIARINIELGTGYLAKGDPERAKQKLLYAIKKAPQLPEAWYSMGYYMEATGNKAQAKDYYLKSIQLEPKRGDVQNNFGTYLCRNGQYQDAIKHFMLAIKDPQYLEAASAYENAGLCALKIPNRALALKYFEQAVAENPNRIVAMAQIDKLKDG